VIAKLHTVMNQTTLLSLVSSLKLPVKRKQYKCYV